MFIPAINSNYKTLHLHTLDNHTYNVYIMRNVEYIIIIWICPGNVNCSKTLILNLQSFHIILKTIRQLYK